MAQHRTKQEKITASIRREQQYSLQDLALDETPLHLQPKRKALSSENLIPYSTKFITSDLVRTFLSAAFVFGALIGVWMYFN